ncbi:MAG: glycosyltransferase family 4 protein [Thermoplasmata archaeon]
MKEKLRICFIGDGRSIHTQRWVKHFSRLGHSVHLISDSPASFDGVTVHEIRGSGFLGFIKKTIQTKRIIKQISPSVVHAHIVFGYGFFGAMAGSHPFVVSPWGSDIARQTEESALFKFIVKFVLKKADAIQCADGAIVSRVKHLIGDTDTIRQVGWGVDTDKFRPASARKTDEIRILYLRLSQDSYSTPVLLEAMPEILKKHGNVKFLLLKKGEHLDKTIEAIGKMGAGGRVELIDYVPHEKLSDILNSCNMYVDTVYSPLPGCGIGMTTIEAMSCGLPVVIADTNGFEQYINHKVTGYIYKGMNSNALARALDELISDRVMREALGNNAREYVMDNQNWNKNMAIMEEMYFELIKEGG